MMLSFSLTKSVTLLSFSVFLFSISRSLESAYTFLSAAPIRASYSSVNCFKSSSEVFEAFLANSSFLAYAREQYEFSNLYIRISSLTITLFKLKLLRNIHLLMLHWSKLSGEILHIEVCLPALQKCSEANSWLWEIEKRTLVNQRSTLVKQRCQSSMLWLVDLQSCLLSRLHTVKLEIFLNSLVWRITEWALYA